MNWLRRLAITTGVLAAVVPATPMFAAAPAPSAPLAGKVIVVDPGHGGRDTGAIANGLREKDLTLPMGLALQAMLESRGARVVMTRTTDVALGGSTDADLQGRVNVAQRVDASAFLSIHANFVSDPNYSGATTYFGPSCGFRSGAGMSPADVGRSYSLGRRVQAALVGATGEVDRGTHDQIYWVLGDPGVPSILVETGFLSNRAEAAKLANPAYEAQVVNAIANGVTDFFASGDDTTPPPAPARALAWCSAPPPVAEPAEPSGPWVQTFLPTPLLGGPDPKAHQFSLLSPFSYLKVLGQKEEYLYVFNPATQGPGYVSASTVGPSGPPPSFRPFWVENFRTTGVWSNTTANAVRFGVAGRWSHFQVIKPQDGPRLFVRVAATGNVAYVDARDVGPSGPPR